MSLTLGKEPRVRGVRLELDFVDEEGKVETQKIEWKDVEFCSMSQFRPQQPIYDGDKVSGFLPSGTSVSIHFLTKKKP